MNCPICRAALPAGSRFCNACGASIGGGAPQGDRTISYPAPQPQAGPPVGRPGAPAPGYSPNPSSYLPPVPQRKKPVALLAALITLVVVGVGGATVALVKNRQQPSVVAGPNGGLVPGNPITEVASSSLPAGPAATSTPVPAPTPGKAVTATPNLPRPKGGDDMAPAVTMGPDRSPTGPSVTSVQSVPVPAAPPVTMAPSSPAKPQAPVTGTPSARPRPAPSVTGTPQPQANNDPVFDKYLQWLQFVEGERQKMDAVKGTMEQQEIKEFYDLVLQMGSDTSPEADRKMMAYPQQKMAQFAEIQRRQQIFWNNMLRTKPPVPEDCKFLDYYYTTAAKLSIQTAQQLQGALTSGNYGAIQVLSKNSAVINANLKRANAELEKVRDVRRLPFTWAIQESGGGGGMGLGLGLPGM